MLTYGAVMALAGTLMCLALYTISTPTPGHTLELLKAGSEKIEYVGIVPYVMHKRQRAVVCDGGSSVGCILGDAATTIKSAFSSSTMHTPGQLAVQRAAQGKGFAWTTTSSSAKANAARKAVLNAAKGGQWGILSDIENGYNQVDNFIDNGGRVKHRHHTTAAERRQKSEDGLREAITALRKEKQRLSKVLHQQTTEENAVRSKKAVKASASGGGLLDWIGEDVTTQKKPWAY